MREITLYPGERATVGDAVVTCKERAPTCSVCAGPIEFHSIEDEKPKLICGATASVPSTDTAVIDEVKALRCEVEKIRRGLERSAPDVALIFRGSNS